ncbi:MAG: hypothetical protein COV35_05900 [Alphaproteobacteria bacterium CG11_big_fil_rev_8_21_14_0_20_39_49]|nr:MAG: hypothetical protein COV35_05900 [Alphaproteobacteria bacterium CG11_big_fil_rev_8_21_14_0_20_39_49]
MNKIKGVITVLIVTSVILPAYSSNNDESDRRLNLTRVSYYIQTDELRKAFNLIDELEKKYPDDVQLFIVAADLNIRVNNRGKALKYIDKAQKLDPLNEDLDSIKASLMHEHGQSVNASARIKKSSLITEQFLKMSGRVYVNPIYNINIIAETDRVKSKNAIVRQDVIAEKFDGQLWRTNLSLNGLFEDGDEFSASLYLGDEETIGVGGEYSFRDRFGSTSIGGNISQPEWEYIESLVGNGTKDDIYIGRKQYVTKSVRASLSTGLNRYNLDEASNVAESHSVDGALSYYYPYVLSQTNDDILNFGLNYSLGAEYFLNRKTKTAPNGDNFKPFPAQTYEIHAMTFEISRDIKQKFHAGAFAGYAKDRFGDSGPLYGTQLRYSPSKKIDIGIYASEGIIGESRAGKVNQLGVNFKYKW